MKKTKKIIKWILKIIIFIVIVVIIYLSFINILKSIRKRNINDENWLNKNIKIVYNEKFGKNIMSIKTKDYVNIFSEKYQKIVDNKINELIRKNNYTLDNPLLIYNPYGTNTLSINIYFNTDSNVKVSYNISVNDKNIKDYSNTLYNEDGFSKNHEYQIIGLIKNKENKILIKTMDENGKEDSKSFKINTPDTKSNVDLKLKTTKGSSKSELENGLYAVLGHDKSFNSNIYLYDNEGVLRGELPLKNYRTDRIEFINNKMLYSYKKSGFLQVNRLGKIDKIYNINGYTMHHDYKYDKKNNKLLILANENGSNSIEDIIISLDLSTGKVKKVLDMKNILEDMYKTAVSPESGNTYGGDELDWIHLNSLDIIGNDIVLSSRELSSIIYIEDIYQNPKLKYIISDLSVYKNTKYEKYVYSKNGEFVSQAGQHTITYVAAEDNTYYLAMYNNNFGSSRTRPDFDWSYFPGVGTYKNGEKSMYYLYEVKEKSRTYKLVKSINLPYSSIVSSIQNLQKNYVTSSGMNHSYGEYDNDGNLIKQFDHTSKKYAYRVFKYSFNKFFFD